MDFEGNVASWFVFDLAALTQWVQGVLLSASAFESVSVVLCYLILQEQEQSVGNSGYHLLLAGDTVCGQFSLVGWSYALSAAAHDLAQQF